MKSPSRPPTPPTSLATPPFTTPPTARSAGIWSRPASDRAPRAESTENSPNRRIAHAPNEMGDQPLNMRAGKFSDWNSMCQKRNGRPRSIVSSRPERMAPTAAMSYPVGIGAIQLGFDPLCVELVDALMRPSAQLDDRPELDRVRGAGLRARGLEPHLEPVVAERALLRGPRHRVHVDDTERARGDARPAAVADVRLDHDRVELSTDDGAGGTHLEASCLDAVLADVAH